MTPLEMVASCIATKQTLFTHNGAELLQLYLVWSATQIPSKFKVHRDDKS